MTCPNRNLTIDLHAMIHNIQCIKNKAPRQKIMACIKANAYGHGFSQIAEAISTHIDGVAVADFDQAIQLRQTHQFKSKILLMSTLCTPAQCKQLSTYDIDWVLFNTCQIQALKACQLLPHPIKLWIKINTGLNRLGFKPKDLDNVMEQLASLSGCAEPYVMMTHLAESEQPHFHFTQQQITLFMEAAKKYELPLSIANSAALFNHSQYLGDWIRPGIMLYGASSLPNRSGEMLDLKPAMTVSATVIHIHKINAHESVGYNRRFIASNQSTIATINIGYGDGYPRNAPDGTPVLINGIICPIVGRVSMDLICVDITANASVQIGDQAILWGEKLPIERIAACIGTSPYELMCHIALSNRSKTVYHYGKELCQKAAIV